jgi:hypothetical protein
LHREFRIRAEASSIGANFTKEKRTKGENMSLAERLVISSGKENLLEDIKGEPHAN